MKIQLWVIDCQKDFINDGGALQVPGAPGIVENLKKLNTAAKDDVIRVFTQDCHMNNDAELSSTPDFKTTFPPHCLAFTNGVEILDEIMPKQPQYFGYSMDLEDLLKNDMSEKLLEAQNYILNKNVFSTFDGNPNAATFVKETAPDIIFVCGVAGDVCVKAVVESLDALNIERFHSYEKEIKIAVITDAVKSLNESVANTYFGKLEEEGYIQLVNTDHVLTFLEMVNGIGDEK